VRDTLLHPVVLLLIFVVVFAAITAVVVLWTWSTTYNPEFERPSGWLSDVLPAALARCFVVSLLISLFLIFGRLKHRPGYIIVSFLLLLILGTLGLFLGFQITDDTVGGLTPARSVKPFISRTFHPTDRGRVYIEKVVNGGASIEGLAIHSESGIRFSQNAAVSVSSGIEGNVVTIVPRESTLPSIQVVPANPIYSPAFTMPKFLKSWIDEINLLNEYLAGAMRGSSSRLLLAGFSLVIFVLGGRFFFRLSRWPLFNVLLTLALFRGVFFTIRFLNSEIGREIISLLPYTDLAPDLASIFYLLVGVLFLAADLILIRKPKSASRALDD